MIKKIQDALRRKKMEKAIREYQGLVEKCPKDTRVRLKLGDMLAGAGRRDEAIDQYMASAEMFSNAGFHLKSVALCKQILKLDPDSQQALRKAAQVFSQHGIYADSLPYYERLADLIRQGGGDERCAGICEQIRSLPIGEKKRKVQLLEAALSVMEGGFSDPYEKLVEIGKEMTGKGAGAADARVLADWLCDFYPDRIEGHEMLVSLLSSSKDESLPDALDRLEKLYRKKGKLEERAGFLREHRKSVRVALKPSREAAEGPLQDDAGERLGRVKVKLDGNMYHLLKQKARERSILETEGSGGTETHGEGDTPADRLKFDDLFENFKESIQEQVASDDSETHYNIGVAYFEMELFEDAMREFELAGESPRFQSDAFLMMGNCSKALDRPDDALAYYDKALACGGLTLEQAYAIRYEQAVALRAAGRDEEALKLFEKIRKRAGDYRDIEQHIRELGGELESEGARGKT